ncbi:MAG: ribonuclease III [Lachnospiraceae bacterium]|nr:ribonuclease III [Lachnospiraceae bacterium]
MQDWDKNIHDLEIKIGYVFIDKLLIAQAFTHRSYVNEQMLKRQPSYERIEFLGDAVLDLITSEHLMDTYPSMAEGELTKARAQMVCESALAHSAKHLELGKYMRLGKGEARTGGHKRASILADVMEALIGAIYSDSGLSAARDFIHRFVLKDLRTEPKFLDSKSMIQEYVIKNGLGKLRYELSGVDGPEHDKIFYTDLYLEETIIGSGSGKSKKGAEQKAAYKALKKITS